MKKLIVIFLVISLFAGANFVASAETSKKLKSETKVTQQKKKQQPKITKKPSKAPTKKSQKKVLGAKALSYIPFTKYEKCIGPDGKTAYALKKDCDNLWSFWNNHKPNNSSNNNNSNNSFSSNNSNNSSSGVNSNTPTMTPVPTFIPTLIPSLTPAPTINITPTLTPTTEPTKIPAVTILPTDTINPTPTTNPTNVPTITPTPTQTITPTPTPTVMPTPTSSPLNNSLPISFFNIPSGGMGLNLVNGLDGNIWFAVDRTGPNAYLYPENVVLEKPIIGSIGKITPSGEIFELTLPSSSNLPLLFTEVGEAMFNLASGPDGNIWFTQPNANIIGKVTTDGVITEFNLSDQNYSPRQIIAGPDGNIWFTDFNKGLVRMDTLGNILGNDPAINNYALSMTTSTDGDVWVARSYSGISKIATDSSSITFDTPGPGRPIEVIGGASNDIWFSQNGGPLSNMTEDGLLTIFNTPGYQAWDITKDANKNIWYKDSASKIIYELDPTLKEISSYLLSTEDEYLITHDMTTGPDGNIWFTTNGQIGKIDMSKKPEVTPTPITPTIIQIPNADPKVEKVTVLPCTSSSCDGITTIIVDGQNFATDAIISLSGYDLSNVKNTYDSSQDGQIVNRTGFTSITVDIYNIACDVYRLNVYSPTSSKTSSYVNLDLKPYTCN